MIDGGIGMSADIFHAELGWVMWRMLINPRNIHQMEMSPLVKSGTKASLTLARGMPAVLHTLDA